MLATVTDLAAYLPDRDVPTPTAALVLEMASALVEGHLGRRLSRVAGETLTTVASGRLVFLPSPPVDVTSVTHDGTAVVDYTVDSGEGILELPAGYANTEVVVTYDSGPTEVPAAAKAVVLAVAARLVTNADGVTQKSIGDVSISYGRAQSGPGLTEWEASALGPLRFPTVR